MAEDLHVRLASRQSRMDAQQSKSRMPTRRNFLKGSAALAAASPFASLAEKTYPLPAVRQITQGPSFHWFGYYDKLEFDPTNRFVLSNQVEFEGRTPTADDRIKVGMVDIEDGDKWTELGKSDAWGWQQGCMLQWRPGSKGEVIWNDREDGQFVCHVLDFRSGKRRTLPRAIYALSADGKYGISADFARIQRLRPGYGYQGVPDPTAKVERPEDSGIWRVDMESGDSELILSIAEISRFQADSLPNDSPDAHHYFNHLLVSPDSRRFIFLHRWRGSKTRSFMTRMLTANLADGSDLRVVDPSGYTSHFIWRDPETITAWSRHESHGNAFYHFKDASGAPHTPQVIGKGKDASQWPQHVFASKARRLDLERHLSRQGQKRTTRLSLPCPHRHPRADRKFSQSSPLRRRVALRYPSPFQQ